MAEQPHYPSSDADHGTGHDHDSAPEKRSWGSVLAVVLGVGFVVLFVALHLTGVAGPGGH